MPYLTAGEADTNGEIDRRGQRGLHASEAGRRRAALLLELRRGPRCNSRRAAGIGHMDIDATLCRCAWRTEDGWTDTAYGRACRWSGARRWATTAAGSGPRKPPPVRRLRWLD